MTTNQSNRRRRWFQFSLRTMLVLVTLLSVWLALTVNAARKQREAVAAIEALGGIVRYEHQSNSSPRTSPQEPPGPKWLRELVSEEYFVTIFFVRLSNTQITDAGLEHLKGLKSLQFLYLDSTNLTDAGLEHLKGLTSLRELLLNSTNVTDEGLEHLNGLTNLKHLDLDGTNVTDEGVKKLQKALPNCNIIP